MISKPKNFLEEKLLISYAPHLNILFFPNYCKTISLRKQIDAIQNPSRTISWAKLFRRKFFGKHLSIQAKIFTVFEQIFTEFFSSKLFFAWSEWLGVHLTEEVTSTKLTTKSGIVSAFATGAYVFGLKDPVIWPLQIKLSPNVSFCYALFFNNVDEFTGTFQSLPRNMFFSFFPFEDYLETLSWLFDNNTAMICLLNVILEKLQQIQRIRNRVAKKWQEASTKFDFTFFSWSDSKKHLTFMNFTSHVKFY